VSRFERIPKETQKGVPLVLISFEFASFLTPHEDKESTMGPSCDPLTTTLANIHNRRASLATTIKCFVHQIFV
jgi:hypothetical protein